MSRPVLVLNCGSSSIKYQLVDTDSGVAQASGLVEKIGSTHGVVTHKEGGQTYTVEGAIPDHAVGLTLMRRTFAEAGTDLSDRGVVAVGHRVVHGGTLFTGPVLVTDEVIGQIKALSVLAPLHNPANLVGIERAQSNFPTLPPRRGLRHCLLPRPAAGGVDVRHRPGARPPSTTSAGTRSTARRTATCPGRSRPSWTGRWTRSTRSCCTSERVPRWPPSGVAGRWRRRWA